MKLKILVFALCMVLAACSQTPSDTKPPVTNPDTNPTNPDPTNPDPTNPDPDPSEPTPSEFAASVTLSADNTSENYIVAKVVGEAVTLLGNDPSWQLVVGKRYKIINTQSTAHPLILQGSEGLSSPLLGQSIQGSFQDDPDVNLVEDDVTGSVSFTLTPKLAVMLTGYICYFHPDMSGQISSQTTAK